MTKPNETLNIPHVPGADGANIAAAVTDTSLARACAAAKAYRPSQKRTHLTDEIWQQWDEYLLPRAVAAVADTTDPLRVCQILSFAAGLLDYCYEQGFADPGDPTHVFRDTTIDRYISGFKNAGKADTTTDATKSALRKLVNAVPLPLPDLTLAAGDPAGMDADEVSAADLAGPVQSPLLSEGPTEDPRKTWADWEPMYWELLGAIRDRVLSVYPNAQAVVTRPRNESIPLGDVEVARLLLATDAIPERGTARVCAKAYLCLGLGAGLRPGEMLRVTGRHVHTDNSGAVTVVVDGSDHKPGRQVPVLSPWAPMLRTLAEQTPSVSLIKGRGNGITAVNRAHDIANIIGRRDPKAVRAESGRLRATWLCVHLASGTPLAQLLDIAGVGAAEALDIVSSYVPATGRDPHRPWRSVSLVLPAPVQRSAQQQARASTVMSQPNIRKRSR